MRADPFTSFVARRLDEKKGHYKKSQIGPGSTKLRRVKFWLAP